MLSQFPAEKEILFAPLTGLEVQSVRRVEGGVILVKLRLSCNLHDRTLEQVIGKMQTIHIDMVQSMRDELRMAGAPDSALKPLEELAKRAKERGHAFFNVPDLFARATTEALEAKAKAFENLAEEANWKGEGPDIAGQIRGAAKLCATHDQHKLAAELLMLAVRKHPVAVSDAEAVDRAIKRFTSKNAAERVSPAAV